MLTTTPAVLFFGPAYSGRMTCHVRTAPTSGKRTQPILSTWSLVDRWTLYRTHQTELSIFVS